MKTNVYENYEVERIEGCRIIKDHFKYNVKWLNYNRLT